MSIAGVETVDMYSDLNHVHVLYMHISFVVLCSAIINLGFIWDLFLRVGGGNADVSKGCMCMSVYPLELSVDFNEILDIFKEESSDSAIIHIKPITYTLL